MGEMRDADWSRANLLRSDWLGPQCSHYDYWRAQQGEGEREGEEEGEKRGRGLSPKSPSLFPSSLSLTSFDACYAG